MRKPGKPTEHWLALLLVLFGSTSRIGFPKTKRTARSSHVDPKLEVLGCGLFSVLRVVLLKGLVITFVVVVVIFLMADLFRQENGYAARAFILAICTRVGGMRTRMTLPDFPCSASTNTKFLPMLIGSDTK
jgi:hypothetical protein